MEWKQVANLPRDPFALCAALYSGIQHAPPEAEGSCLKKNSILEMDKKRLDLKAHHSILKKDRICFISSDSCFSDVPLKMSCKGLQSLLINMLDNLNFPYV